MKTGGGVRNGYVLCTYMQDQFLVYNESPWSKECESKAYTSKPRWTP